MSPSWAPSATNPPRGLLAVGASVATRIATDASSR